MKSGGSLVVREMTRPEADFAIELALREGWNPGLHDAECFYQADPGGFFIGLLDDVPIGCVSAISYEGGFGFVGFYIVVPEYRGRGYGIGLWQPAMKRLEGHNIGLDGVLAQEANYVRSGFHRAYRNVRFEGRSSRPPLPETAEVRSLREVPFEKVAAYDRQCFPGGRTLFLRGWLQMPASIALGYVEGDQLRGYGVMRRCRQGHKVGPLFADDGDIAERLHAHLASRAQEAEPVYLDVPESNPAAMALVRKLDMREVFATARMYSGKEPDMALEKVFGVTSLELG